MTPSFFLLLPLFPPDRGTRRKRERSSRVRKKGTKAEKRRAGIVPTTVVSRRGRGEKTLTKKGNVKKEAARGRGTCPRLSPQTDRQTDRAKDRFRIGSGTFHSSCPHSGDTSEGLQQPGTDKHQETTEDLTARVRT